MSGRWSWWLYQSIATFHWVKERVRFEITEVLQKILFQNLLCRKFVTGFLYSHTNMTPHYQKMFTSTHISIVWFKLTSHIWMLSFWPASAVPHALHCYSLLTYVLKDISRLRFMALFILHCRHGAVDWYRDVLKTPLHLLLWYLIIASRSKHGRHWQCSLVLVIRSGQQHSCLLLERSLD